MEKEILLNNGVKIRSRDPQGGESPRRQWSHPGARERHRAADSRHGRGSNA